MLHIVKVIRADLYRLRKERTLKIIILICLVYTLLYAIPFNEILEKITNSELNSQNISRVGASAFFTLDYNGIFDFIVPFLIVSIYVSEFSKKTIRIMGSVKISRTSIFVGKYIVFSLTVCVLMALCAVISTFFFTFINGWGEKNVFPVLLKLCSTVFLSALLKVTYASTTIFFSLFLHNGAAIILVYFGSSILESMFASLMLSLSAGNKLFSWLAYIFPSYYMNSILEQGVESPLFVGAILSMTIYVIFTLLLGSFVFQKRDITA